MFLCIDYGLRYVGLAATDIDGKVTYRYGTIDQKKENIFDKLEEITAKERIEKVIVGLPISLEGSETEQTEVTREFIVKLKQRLNSNIHVDTIDETLTSVEAARTITMEGGNKENEHAEAARIMLEQYLSENS